MDIDALEAKWRDLCGVIQGGSSSDSGGNDPFLAALFIFAESSRSVSQIAMLGLLHRFSPRRPSNHGYTFNVNWTVKAKAALSAVVVGMLSSSCSFVLAPQMEQCETNADCQGLGFPNMTCVQQMCVEPRAEEPAPQETTDPRFACRSKAWEMPGEGTVPYELNIASLLGGQPYSGLTLKVCPSFDAKCESPLGEATSDDQGQVSFDLPVGFRGHLLAEAPASDPTLIPFEAYVFPPPSKDPEVAKRPGLVVTNLKVMQGLASLDSATVVPGSGHLIFTVSDCQGKPLEGVTVRPSITQDETWKVFVGSGGRPDPNLKATGPSGKGAILNLPPGYLKVIGEHPTHGKIFEQSIVINSNKLTSVPVTPSPVPKS